ncbi:CBS domain-containing protein [Streptomyces hesseae]|uniref:CBS domain-containing protein n=1 Tax=Streptomyces hesseae TaxID=3075519 RepID=A0ABU2SKQ5_9ACTN|nr:CBS domain-containing protein [Streptomyces sp. DSM 40473]MDT0449556.1 CBS domain-containing protein [Streptomyces sp. DSM 40473]
MQTLTVGQIMTSRVARARPGTSFEGLVRLLRRRGVSGVPVLDRDDKVVGVVSEKDLEKTRERRVTAAELMSSPAITMHPEQRAVDAARIMDRHRVNRLPVVDEEDRLIGIVTRGDLLRLFLRTDAAIRADIEGQVLPRTVRAPEGAVRVAVHDGVVMLDGQVPATVDIPGAVRQTWRVDGVTGVVSRLHTGHEPTGDRKRAGGPKSPAERESAG